LTEQRFDRRALIAGIAAATVMARSGAAQTLPPMLVHKDPNCGCCSGWVKHIEAAGFAVEVIETSQLNKVKARLGVPGALASCHTAELAGYVIEGHVPAAAIKRLLAGKPQAKGLAVPGMPIGSPGMEVEGTPAETYEVILFGPGERRFARFQGDREI
jgi:hypothetical protein